MNEQEKRELIKAINEIREELNLKPYPLEQLEYKDLEELRKLYHQYFFMKEEYRKRLKEEKKKFKFSWKTGLLVGISLAFLLSSLLYLQLYPQVVPIQTEEGKEKEEVLDFILTFGYIMGNDPVFILHNRGSESITSFNVRVDGVRREYEIISGSIPIEPYKTLYFLISGLCDNKTHEIEVTSDSVRTNFTLTNECETGSRLE